MNLFAFFGAPWEMIVVALVALLLFGNRLPNVMRNLGQGISEFKRGVEQIVEPIGQVKEDIRKVGK
jgi:sec-independent protein translocase protein TatA